MANNLNQHLYDSVFLEQTKPALDKLHMYNTNKLVAATRIGLHERLPQLMATHDPKAERSCALHWAAATGKTQCLQVLLPHSVPEIDHSAALLVAAFNGHADCVELLLPHSDAKAQQSCALRAAAEDGHVQCVRMLIPHSDPKANNSRALAWAAIRGHVACVEALLDVSDCAAAWQTVCSASIAPNPAMALLAQKTTAQEQRHTLQSVVDKDLSFPQMSCVAQRNKPKI